MPFTSTLSHPHLPSNLVTNIFMDLIMYKNKGRSRPASRTSEKYFYSTESELVSNII
jgi:hypothetical protein